MQFTRQFVSELARRAIKAYVEDRKSLNDSVAELASEYDLNVEQIKRLCEAVNIGTNDALASPKTTFELADSAKIIERLQPRPAPGLEKEASMKSSGARSSLDGLYNAIVTDEQSLAAFEESMVPPTEKTASLQMSQTRGSAVKSLFDGITHMMEKTASECNVMEIRAECTARQFVDTLIKEGNARGSVNTSFTAMMKLASDDRERLQVRALYRRALNKIASMNAWRRPVDGLQEINLNAIPDPNASLVKNARELLKMASALEIKKRVVRKLAERRAKLLQSVDDVLRVAQKREGDED